MRTTLLILGSVLLLFSGVRLILPTVVPSAEEQLWTSPLPPALAISLLICMLLSLRRTDRSLARLFCLLLCFLAPLHWLYPLEVMPDHLGGFATSGGGGLLKSIALLGGFNRRSIIELLCLLILGLLSPACAFRSLHGGRAGRLQDWTLLAIQTIAYAVTFYVLDWTLWRWSYQGLAVGSAPIAFLSGGAVLRLSILLALPFLLLQPFTTTNCAQPPSSS